jgi:hypothetical protein
MRARFDRSSAVPADLFDTVQTAIFGLSTLHSRLPKKSNCREETQTMEPNSSLQAATVLLGVGAAGGLVMAGIRLKGADRPPSWLAMLHGVLAAAALTLLAYAAYTAGIPPLAKYALVVLVLAALGGAAINLMYHSKMLPLPIPLVIGHALVAAVGFVLLLVCVMGLGRPG